jgi:hypothetical protein
VLNHLTYEEIELKVDRILLQWQQDKIELEEYFKYRDSKKALPVMEKTIKLFREFLYASNGLITSVSNNIDDCIIKPVNVQERLKFIVSRPRLYHSYVQLGELFAEQEKQYARKVALNKAKKKRPD